MTTPTIERDDDKEFVIATISRAEVREICGEETADKLSDEDMKRLAEELADSYIGGTFVTDLEEVIRDKF